MTYCNVWEPDGSRHFCRKCDTTFARKVRSVALQYTYGRDTFKGPTVKEQNDHWRKDWERQGIAQDIVPADRGCWT